MSDDRDRPDDAEFNADAWFASQFGGEPAPVVPPQPPELQPAAPVDLPPTEPIPELESTQAYTLPAPAWDALPPADSPTGPAPDAATELLRTPDEGGALDELFGTEKFQEYQDELIPAVTRAPRGGSGGTGGGGTGGDGTGGDSADDSAERPPMSRTQKVLIWVAGGLVAVLALVAIFVISTRIPGLIGAAPAVTPSASPTPTPTPTETVRPIGPVAPGDYAWDELWGGECLDPFVDAWQDSYTVVDCADAHPGQLVFRGPFPLVEGATEAGPYPGEDALQAQISLLCGAPGVIDLVAASQFLDVQVQGSFPVTEEQWDEGQQDYFCFVSRSSGEVLTGTLAVAAPAV